MSEQEGKVTGPAMVVATSVMKKPPLRVAKITDDIVLPRSIPAKTIVVGAAGALVGLIIGAFFQSWTSMFYGAGIFATIAILLMNLSPLQGESIWKWFSLVWKGRKGKTSSSEGEKVRLYVGICPVPRAASEATVHIWPGAVRIVANDYDERGVAIDHRTVRPDAPISQWDVPGAQVPFGMTVHPIHMQEAAPGMVVPAQLSDQPTDQVPAGRRSLRRRRGTQAVGDAPAPQAPGHPNLHAWDASAPPGRP